MNQVCYCQGKKYVSLCAMPPRRSPTTRTCGIPLRPFAGYKSACAALHVARQQVPEVITSRPCDGYSVRSTMQPCPLSMSCQAATQMTHPLAEALALLSLHESFASVNYRKL
jgi:hypothetical protein